jgi:hypothetical protein
VHDHIVTPAEITANSLRETRQRIHMKVIEEDDEERECIALERRYVTDVYDQAIAKLGELPDNHIQIAAECTRKVRVILGIITANPSDPVFTTAGQLLKPLEPRMPTHASNQGKIRIAIEPSGDWNSGGRKAGHTSIPSTRFDGKGRRKERGWLAGDA